MVDMLLTGFDAPVEQVLYLDRPLREHGLLQAIARVNRRFSHEKDGTPTEKGHGLVVDYCGISHDLEQALASFEWDGVQDTMQAAGGGPGHGHRRRGRQGRVPLQRATTSATPGPASFCSRRTPTRKATTKPTCSSGSTPTTASSLA